MRFWWQPADYRTKATKYAKKAQSASSPERRQRYSELASLYLAYAEVLESKIALRRADQERSKRNLLPG